MISHVTAEERAALLNGYDAALNAEIVARVEADAEKATALPWWFWEFAAVVVVGTIALSAAFPWGVAP